MVKALLANSHFVKNTLYILCYNVINTLLLSCIVYYATYIMGSTGASTPIQAAYLVMSLGMSFAVSAIDRKLGRRKTMILATFFYVFGKVWFVLQPKSAAATDVPQEYLSAIAAVMEENPSLKAAISAMVYVSTTGDVVLTEFPKKNLMYLKILERKAAIFNKALTEKFGRTMTISMRAEGLGSAAPKTSAPAKNIIEQSYDIFGRENIEIKD